jgi:hypothetical protein
MPNNELITRIKINQTIILPNKNNVSWIKVGLLDKANKKLEIITIINPMIVTMNIVPSPIFHFNFNITLQVIIGIFSI